MFRWGSNGLQGKPRAESHRVLASVRELSWEGYWALVADIFRHRGNAVFAGEGPDRDVIDMEVSRDGLGRLIVNCQLRGMRQISTAPLEEMIQVAERNGADGVLLITDGDFSPEAHSYAAGRPLILVDGDALLDLVLELTLGDERDRRLGVRLARIFSRGSAN
ncbi:MAG TPA: restriction endonuclease [Candidatus Dormibacteraeota bacterium]|nr:restriction endonuclease [Candidatus Dormibacteraeota bacterium]